MANTTTTKTKPKKNCLQIFLVTISIIVSIVLGLSMVVTSILLPIDISTENTIVRKYINTRSNKNIIQLIIDDIEKKVDGSHHSSSHKSSSSSTIDTNNIKNVSFTIPPEAFIYNNHSYYVFSIDNVTSYNGAEEYCESLGGHLATISSEEENQNVFSYISSLNIESAYIGLSDEQNEGDWQWVNGEQLSYSKWAEGEPNGENANEDYAMYYYKYSDGSWNDGDFDGVSPCFVCEWEPASNIPADAISYKDNLYMVYTTSVSWEDASKHCESIGGHLATISDITEQKFLENILSSHTEKVNYWIGGRYSVTDNAWQWVDNTPFQYTNWDSWSDGTDTFSQPDNHYGNEVYLRMTNTDIQYETWNAHCGKWNDTANEGDGETGDANLNTFGFICEWGV